MRLVAVAGMVLVSAGLAQAASEITRPRVMSSVVDWPVALGVMAKSDGLEPAPDENQTGFLTRINAVSARYLPNVAASSVPVLLPFDVAALLRDRGKAQDAGEVSDGEKYFFGFHPPRFFLAGPAGYDSAFTIQTSEIRELSEINVPDPVEIQMSGMGLYYELDETAPDSRPVPALEAAFPGIRRVLAEGHVRYAFTRFGVPYVLSIECFDGKPRHVRLICTQADRIAVHFLNALHVAGGTPRAPATVEPPVIVRPQTSSPTFTYYGPGNIYPASGFRGAGGRVDYTVYAPMRFPLADSPAYAGSQIYRTGAGKGAARQGPSTEFTYPWRDNFCERRGFAVGQCPGGIGHQGQDIRPAQCGPGTDRCNPAHDLVAVRDGAILRSPKQEAVYIVVNTANEHVRFRYLHMEPHKMDEDNLLSGRDVREGEVIGQVSNYSQKENGTSYHLHFDIQVPTKNGWMFVNPYMTLVVAYERLIGGRGTEISDTPQPAPTAAPESESNSAPQPASPASTDSHPKARREGTKSSAKDRPGASESLKNPND